MSGPAPEYRPRFSDDFVQEAKRIVRRRTASYQLRQRAALVLLLHESPSLSNSDAARCVHLHANSVRLWRKRWAGGVLSLDDNSGRGRKPRFSPSG